MGAWIEINIITKFVCFIIVAPHDGCVDWNFTVDEFWKLHTCRTPRWVRGLKFDSYRSYPFQHFVAPHDGCVDWNSVCFFHFFTSLIVAPHDGCVDWNDWLGRIINRSRRSHPTMGAWIEIEWPFVYRYHSWSVAPHDGCVDWNLFRLL